MSYYFNGVKDALDAMPDTSTLKDAGMSIATFDQPNQNMPTIDAQGWGTDAIYNVGNNNIDRAIKDIDEAWSYVEYGVPHELADAIRRFRRALRGWGDDDRGNDRDPNNTPTPDPFGLALDQAQIDGEGAGTVQASYPGHPAYRPATAI